MVLATIFSRKINEGVVTTQIWFEAPGEELTCDTVAEVLRVNRVSTCGPERRCEVGSYHCPPDSGSQGLVDLSGCGIYCKTHSSVNQILQGLAWCLVDTSRCLRESDIAGIGLESSGHSTVSESDIVGIGLECSGYSAVIESDIVGIGVKWIQHGVSVNQIVQGLAWSVVDTVRRFSESDIVGIGLECVGYSTAFQ
ncbi:hypothetical protein RRG08_018334 [Elysia crispata]|uniref:Uncharacterized protein n=1 Tax=Elysia crispata TaxID=231223 RepID=A0AAE0Y0D0_9GAST|nr:hypothetical protein RRG08_018334 [Elysia crispata]